MIKLIGQIPVKRSFGFRIKKASLTVGLVATVIAIILECIINNYFMIALIIPGLYLLNIRIKMGKSVLCKDVEIIVAVDNSEITVIQENIIAHEDKTYSRKYVFNKNMIQELSYSNDALLSFKFNGEYSLIQNNKIIETKQLNKYKLSFYVSQKDANIVKQIITNA